MWLELILDYQAVRRPERSHRHHSASREAYVRAVHYWLGGLVKLRVICGLFAVEAPGSKSFCLFAVLVACLVTFFECVQAICIDVWSWILVAYFCFEGEFDPVGPKNPDSTDTKL